MKEKVTAVIRYWKDQIKKFFLLGDKDFQEVYREIYSFDKFKDGWLRQQRS